MHPDSRLSTVQAVFLPVIDVEDRSALRLMLSKVLDQLDQRSNAHPIVGGTYDCQL